MAPPLDNPTWPSLTGPHARFAQRHGQVVRYPPEVAPFLARSDRPDDRVWADVAASAGPDRVVPMNTSLAPPAGWQVVDRIAGVRLVDDGVPAAEDRAGGDGRCAPAPAGVDRDQRGVHRPGAAARPRTVRP